MRAVASVAAIVSVSFPVLAQQADAVPDTTRNVHVTGRVVPVSAVSEVAALGAMDVSMRDDDRWPEVDANARVSMHAGTQRERQERGQSEFPEMSVNHDVPPDPSLCKEYASQARSLKPATA